MFRVVHTYDGVPTVRISNPLIMSESHPELTINNECVPKMIPTETTPVLRSQIVAHSDLLVDRFYRHHG